MECPQCRSGGQSPGSSARRVDRGVSCVLSVYQHRKSRLAVGEMRFPYTFRPEHMGPALRCRDRGRPPFAERLRQPPCPPVCEPSGHGGLFVLSQIKRSRSAPGRRGRSNGYTPRFVADRVSAWASTSLSSFLQLGRLRNDQHRCRKEIQDRCVLVSIDGHYLACLHSDERDHQPEGQCLREALARTGHPPRVVDTWSELTGNFAEP